MAENFRLREIIQKERGMTMSFFGNIYRLKDDTTEKDIWSVILNTLKETKCASAASMPAIPPKQFVLKTEADEIITWKMHEKGDNDPFSKFAFIGKIQDIAVSLEIYFHQETQRDHGECYHHLIFKSKQLEDTSFLFIFFEHLTKYVRKKYTNSQPKISVTEELLYTGSPKKIFQRNMELVNKDYYGVITFSADSNGNFCSKPIQNNEIINSVTKELWFLNVSFEMEDLHKLFRKTIKKFQALSCSIPNSIPPTPEDREKIIMIAASLDDDVKPVELLKSDESPAEEEFPKDLCRYFIKSFDLEKLFHEILSLSKENLDRYTSFLVTESDSQSNFWKKTAEEHRRIAGDYKKNLEEQRKSYEKQIQTLQKQNSNVEANAPIPSADNQPNNLIQEIQSLENKNKGLQRESKALRAENNELRERIQRLEQKFTAKQNDDSEGMRRLEIPCSEKNLFPNEIENFLYLLLYSSIEKEDKNQPDERTRKRDILQALLTGKTFDWDDSETCDKLRDLEKLRESPNVSISKVKRLMEQLGFKHISENSHQKYQFYGDPRYQVIVPTSPSDQKSGAKNLCSEIENHCFSVITEKNN